MTRSVSQEVWLPEVPSPPQAAKAGRQMRTACGSVRLVHRGLLRLGVKRFQRNDFSESTPIV